MGFVDSKGNITQEGISMIMNGQTGLIDFDVLSAEEKIQVKKLLAGNFEDRQP